MKKAYISLAIGMALLIAAPVATNSTIALADTDNTSAITQGESDSRDDFNAQLNRINDLLASGKYNNEQKDTLNLIYQKYISESNNTTDAQLIQLTNKLKDYLDKGVVDYTIYPSSQIMGESMTGVESEGPATNFHLTFKAVNKPQIQQLSVNGYTILDLKGNPTDGKMSMWIDSNYKLHLDPKFGAYSNGWTDFKIAKNGVPYTAPDNSGKWTDRKGVVATHRDAVLYTLAGDLITDRELGAHSYWYTDRYATINGEKMYRVATDEWVRDFDVVPIK